MSTPIHSLRRALPGALEGLVVLLLVILAPGLARAATVTVQPGETLGSIASRNGVSVSSLAAANGIANPDRVVAGTRLVIPGAGAPTATVSSSSTTASSGTHTVLPGETLGTIAARYGVSTSALASANGISNPNMVRQGAHLAIPGHGAPAATVASTSSSGGTYTVRPGESLGAIAARYGVSTSALASANGISNPNLVRQGQRLTIPSGAANTAGTAIPAVTTTGATGYHTVRNGETLCTIAAHYRVPIGALISANGIRNPDLLTVGSRLRVPTSSSTVVQATTPSGAVQASAGSGTHRVSAGETLASIASRYGTSVTTLAALNGITDSNTIAIGRVLRVPGGAVGGPYIGPRTVSSSQVVAMINGAAARYGVDPALARAIAYQESGFNHNVRSNVGAIGAMQLMPETAQWVGPLLVRRQLNPYSLRDNIDGGVAYLAWLQRRTGSARLSAAGYYQGYNRLRERGMYDDTKEYVRSVMGHYGRV